MSSKVKENAPILAAFSQSMQLAIERALKGSDAEDGYFLEKLEKTANCMGFQLTEKEIF